MNTYNDIARYVEGDMTADERSAFETNLASDAALRQQLALYQEVNASLQQNFRADEQRQQLQHTMQSLRGEFFGAASQPAKVIPFKRYLRAAVAVAAILIAVVFVWQPWKPSLFNKFSETSMVAPAERGNNASSLLQQAVTAFNKKEYAAAETLLQQVKEHDTANSYVNFYYGVALLKNGRVAEARRIFEQLYAGQSAFKFEAAFFQALGYLAEKNNAASKEWLHKIPADAANYDKAQELLQELK
jgi:predicted Zn-dependent protease